MITMATGTIYGQPICHTHCTTTVYISFVQCQSKVMGRLSCMCTKMTDFTRSSKKVIRNHHDEFLLAHLVPYTHQHIHLRLLIIVCLPFSSPKSDNNFLKLYADKIISFNRIYRFCDLCALFLQLCIATV